MIRPFKKEYVRILGIETSCDETAAAVVEDGQSILSNIVASQVDLHSKYGGIFPEVASREHIRVIHPVVEQALNESHLSMSEIDAIAVTRGPGLVGSLVVGINFAKGAALSTGLPLLGINHLEGHLYSAWLKSSENQEYHPPQFPLLALIVSGGHTSLILMEEHLTYKRLGSTLDDAAGEAFDKVARLLSLPYPGGPSIQKASESGNPLAFNFPRAWLEGTWNFSFSGLKTAVLRTLQELHSQGKPVHTENIAASFQAAVVDVLAKKTLLAARHFQVKEILVAGGVSANRALRKAFSEQDEFKVHIPPLALCTDNAVMISAAGFYHYKYKEKEEMDFDALPNWPLGNDIV